MSKRIILAIISGIFMCVSAMAQNGTIRGNVYEKETGNPIIHCNVLIEGTKLGATTDLDGFYVISNVPPGEYKLVATYIGFDSISAFVKVKKSSVVYQALTMAENAVQLGEVSISAAKEISRTTVNISQVSVTPKQIKSLPSVGGEADIVQYLQVIPGIVSTGDQGGQIYIRGGSPVQNKILLDGLNIFNRTYRICFFDIIFSVSISS